MFDRIRELFSKPRSNLSDEAREFITKLATSEIWILAIGVRGTPTTSTINDPTGFDIIAGNRIDVSEINDNDSVSPFNYEQDGKQTLPFFSSEQRARDFAAAKGFPRDPTVYQPYSLLAGFVATPDNDIFELVLDAASADERRLGRDERLLLRSLTSPS